MELDLTSFGHKCTPAKHTVAILSCALCIALSLKPTTRRAILLCSTVITHGTGFDLTSFGHKCTPAKHIIATCVYHVLYHISSVAYLLLIEQYFCASQLSLTTIIHMMQDLDYYMHCNVTSYVTHEDKQ